MNKSAILALIVSAGVVIGIGYPILKDKHTEPPLYVPDKVPTTEDIQDFDVFWNALGDLQKDAAELGNEEFKAQALEMTMDFLQLEDQQRTRFIGVANEALEQIVDARARLNESNLEALRQMQETAADDSDVMSTTSKSTVQLRQRAQKEWQEAQDRAANHLLEALSETPRHSLLVEKRLFWLMKIDYSMREAENDKS